MREQECAREKLRKVGAREMKREGERERLAGGTFCAQNMEKRQVVLVSARQCPRYSCIYIYIK